MNLYKAPLIFCFTSIQDWYLIYNQFFLRMCPHHVLIAKHHAQIHTTKLSEQVISTPTSKHCISCRLKRKDIVQAEILFIGSDCPCQNMLISTMLYATKQP